MRRPIITLLAALSLCAGSLILPALAQENGPTETGKRTSVYKVDFRLTESSGGKIVSTRSYSLRLADGVSSRIRTGNRVPFTTGENLWQYMDIGLNIDCGLNERGEAVELRISYDIERLASTNSDKLLYPVIHKVSSNFTTQVLPGKPTIVSSIDDASSDARYELEVTVTKVQ